MSPFAAIKPAPLYVSVALLTAVAGLSARSENTRDHAVHADSLATVTQTDIREILTRMNSRLDSVHQDGRVLLISMCAKDHNPQVCDRIGK